MNEYDWEDILDKIRGFARVEEIDDIIVLGNKGGVRRILITEMDD